MNSPGLPRVWMSYTPLDGPERDFDDLLAHGVDCVSWPTGTVAEARAALELARRRGMRLHIDLPEITENAPLVREAGLTPVDALMIGGACRGRAIDRHLFALGPRRHRLIIEPPVYKRGFAYAPRIPGSHERQTTCTMGHYFPDMPPPARAEVVVPLAPFDGRQHLAIVPAEVRPAAPGERPEQDSVTPDLPASEETAARRLYALSFDLTPFAGAMLDRVGLAVYWPYHGTDRYWIFGHGTASASAASTREALRHHVRRIAGIWSEANGGAFPSDVVAAARFGDECFYITGHLDGPAASLPLWDYSEPAVAAFAAAAGGLAYPRTWGFPEVYGTDAYALWQYQRHEACAALCALIREELAARAPGVRLFRNTTRMGVFDHCNDHDGSGQELLTRHLDLVHLDPYPVVGDDYLPVIPRDMGYCAGLARRYGRPLVPWMQAHTYGGPRGLQHVTPAHVARMAAEQRRQGCDAVVWLGYGRHYTFPRTRPDSWEEAARFHAALRADPPRRPVARLAVVRDYGAWSLSSPWEEHTVRNPADWLLQQFLEVWGVERGHPYDVFEVPPRLAATAAEALRHELARYTAAVGTAPLAGVQQIGAPATAETAATDPAAAASARAGFAALADDLEKATAR